MKAKIQGLLSVTVLTLFAAMSLVAQTNTVQLTYNSVTTQYNSITQAYAALSDVNAGPALIELLTGYTGANETFSLGLGAKTGASGTNTITIQPAVTGLTIQVAGTVISITGSYVTIDGRVNGTGSTKDLVIQSLTAFGVAIQFSGDASNNTIKYCKVYSSNIGSSSGVIRIGTGAVGATTGVDNTTIQNCDIGDNTGGGSGTTPQVCISVTGAAAFANDNTTISNCNIFNFNSTSDAAGVRVNALASNVNVNNNSFYYTSSQVLNSNKNVSALFINGDAGTNVLFTNNFIGGNAPSCAGTMTMTGAGVFRGVRIGSIVNGSTATVVSNNTFQNISFTTTNASTSNSVMAIGNSTTAGLFTVSGNVVSSCSVTVPDAAAEFGGIITSTSGAVTISGNSISSITYATATGAGSSTIRGINLSAGSGTVVSNNMISLGSGSETGNWIVYGIEKGTANNAGIYFNTISLAGTPGGAANSAAVKRTSSGTDLIENNILYNTRTGGTGKHGAIILNNLTTITSNYNDLYSATSSTVGSINAGAAFTDFATFKSGSSQDANSVSVTATFASASDLHLASGSIGDFNLTGTPIGGITTDFDGQTRDATSPYMGADENLVSPLPVELSSFTASAHGRSVELLWNTTTETNNSGFEVQKNIGGSWSKIGFVEGAGTSSSPRSYNFSDVNNAAAKYSYRLKQIDRDGKFTYSNAVEVTTTLTAEDFKLSQNYPNPFNPSTKFSFASKNAERTTVKVYNIVGEEVATLFNDVAQPGQVYTMSFDAKDLSSGMYFYVLRSQSRNEVKKMMLMK